MARPSLAATLFVLTLLAFAPARAADYYFAANGVDTNAGTQLSPMKSVKKANELLRQTTAINRVFFKRGDTWYDSRSDHRFNLQDRSGTGMTTTTRLEINAWGSTDDAPPVISSMNKLTNAGWTRLGTSSTWYKQVDYTDAWRLYVDGVSRLSVKDTADPSPTEYDVGLYQWFIKPSPTVPGKGIVYVNSGSTVNPPQNVEVHPVGSESVLFMMTTSNVVVQNIDFRGGSQYNVVHIDAPSDHIIFDTNFVRQANASGLLVGSHLNANTAYYVYNIQITNSTFDKTWTTAENDDSRRLDGDGIFLLHAVDTGLVKGNTVTNWGHVGITLSAYRPGFHGVHNIRVEDNDITAGNSGYMHGFDVSGFMDGCTNNVICRNYIYNYTATCHALGNGNKFYSNIFSGMKKTTMSQHTGFQPYGLDIETFWAGEYGCWIVGRDNIVANNTFYGMDGYAISLGEMLSHSPGGNNPYTVNNNKIYNNIMMRCGLAATGTPICLAVSTSVRGTNPIRNNIFWNPQAPNATTAATVIHGNTSYNATALDAAFTQCDGNLQAGPVFDAFFGLTGSAPIEIRAGGLDIDSIMDAGFKDYDGSLWLDDGGQTPSIGAIQYYP